MALFPVLTKDDKVSAGARARHVQAFRAALGLARIPLCYSIKRHASREEFWKAFHDWTAPSLAGRRENP